MRTINPIIVAQPALVAPPPPVPAPDPPLPQPCIVATPQAYTGRGRVPTDRLTIAQKHVDVMHTVLGTEEMLEIEKYVREVGGPHLLAYSVTNLVATGNGFSMPAEAAPPPVAMASHQHQLSRVDGETNAHPSVIVDARGHSAGVTSLDASVLNSGYPSTATASVQLQPF